MKFTGRKRAAFLISLVGAGVLAVLLLAGRMFFMHKAPAAAEKYTPAKHVLFISSYSESFVTVDLQKAGLRDVFGSAVAMDCEYMDTKQYSDEENTALFHSLLAYKLKKHARYDAIVLGDDAALSFAERYQNELFSGIPMVFFAVNDIEHALKAGRNPYITGAVEKFYLSDTVDAAAKFQPGARTIIAIYDDTQTGMGDQKQFWGLEKQYHSYAFEGIDFSACSLAAFKTKLAGIQKGSIVIYMTAFEDADKNQYTIDQIAPIISGCCPVPVYRTSIGGVGEGLIGGKMVSYEGLGRQAASMTMQILAGRPVSGIPVETEGVGQYIFDEKVLKKYGIPLSLLPPGSELVNRSPDFYTLHRTAIIIMLIILILISIMFSFYLFLRRRSTEQEKQLLDRILMNIPIGISTSEFRDGHILSQHSNPQFTQLLGVAAADPSPEAYRLVMSRISGDDIEQVKSTQRELSLNETARHYVFRYHPDGKERTLWFAADSRSVAEKDGRIETYSVVRDITSEKNAEAEIERNRLMYETAAEMAGLCMWNYDIGTHCIIMSDTRATRQLKERYGIPDIIENVPDSEEVWISEEDFGKYRQIYSAIDRGEKQVSCEYWYKPDSSGKQRCEFVNYSTVFDESGKPVWAYGIGQDVTARKLEAENYRRWYTQLAEADPDAICSFRLNLSRNLCVGGQSKYNELLDLQRAGSADALLSGVIELIVERAAKRECRAVMNSKSLLSKFYRGTANVEREFPAQILPDEVWWLRENIHMVHNPDTGDVEAIASAVNITKRKQTEQIIKIITMDNQEFIAIINTEKATLGFANGVWDAGEPFALENLDYRTCVEGVAAKYVASEKRREFLDALSLDHLRAVLSRSQKYIFTYTMLEKGMEPLKKQLYFSWLDSTKREIMAAQSDITAAYEEEQERTQQLQTALRAAEAASSAKSDFVSRISHDIRTPISAITSMTDFAFEDMDNPEKLRDDLEKIKTSNSFLLSLINDILDISKIDRGQIELHPEPYPPSECVQNIRNIFEAVCREKNLNFEMDLDEGSAVPLVDKVRINQIILNLISNAIKYTHEGGSVKARLSNSRNAAGTLECCFEVKDSGIGMSAGFQKIMFEPFTQDEENPERIKLAGGTGLGLAIVKKLVDMMGGTIQIESRMGEGTDISVKLFAPEYHGDRKNSGRRKDSLEIEKLSGRVLIAEDNDINAQIAIRLLEHIGLKSVRAVNGREALEQFEASAAGSYCCILMDLRMPVMNGYEAAGAIRLLERPDAKTIPIIALTADAIIKEDGKIDLDGMNAYLTKPIDVEQLYRTIRGCITES